MVEIVIKDAEKFFQGEETVLNEYVKRNGKIPKKRFLLEELIKPYTQKIAKHIHKETSIVRAGKSKNNNKPIYRLVVYDPVTIPIVSSRNKEKLERYKLLIDFYREILKREKVLV